MTKVLIIGLDGATWAVMNPLIEEGKLPNIQKLMKEGVYGKLRSIEPLMSPCVWTSIATGKLPEKHGAVTFYDTALQIKSNRIWDIIEENNRSKKIGLFCWPLTWPPRKINGFMIPSLFARTAETYPPELSFINEITFGVKEKKRRNVQEKLKYMFKSLKYGLRFRTVLKIVKYILQSKIFNMSDKEKNYKLRLLKLYMHTDFFLCLLKKYNPYFATFFLNQTDAFAHGYWKYYQPEFFPGMNEKEVKRYKNVIPLAYIEADKAIGRIFKKINDDTIVLLVSDHGSKPAAKYKRNRLRISADVILEKLNLKDKVEYVIADSNLIFIFTNRNYKNEIINMFRGIKVKAEDEKSLLKVSINHLGHIILDLNFEEDTRDVTVDLGNNVTCKYSDLVILDNFDKRSGDHDVDGIFILKGNDIKKNKQIENISILDITPTLLALLRLPIPKDVDGCVLKEIFEEDSDLAKRPIKYHEGEDEKNAIRKKVKYLKDLGKV